MTRSLTSVAYPRRGDSELSDKDQWSCRICLSNDRCLLDPRQDSVLRPHYIEQRTKSARQLRWAKLSRWVLKSCKCSGSAAAIHYGCLRECIISSLIFSSKLYDKVLCCTVCTAPYQLNGITWLTIEEDIRLLLDKFPYPDNWDKKPYAFLKHLMALRESRGESSPYISSKVPAKKSEFDEENRGHQGTYHHPPHTTHPPYTAHPPHTARPPHTAHPPHTARRETTSGGQEETNGMPKSANDECAKSAQEEIKATTTPRSVDECAKKSARGEVKATSPRSVDECAKKNAHERGTEC